MSQLAKEDLRKAELTDAELNQLRGAVDWHLQQAALRQENNIEVQRRIFDLQKEKQIIIDRLKRWLSCLDDANCTIEKEPDSREASFHSVKKVFEYQLDGKTREATVGEIMTDAEWNIFYHLDKKTTPRALLKKYFLERTKHELGQLLDFQIIASERASRLVDPFKKGAYGALEMARKSNTLFQQSGFIAESMVKNMLRKLAYDVGADFDIIVGDVFQDVEQKIDFIIHKKKKFRGVSVEASDKVRDIGIQFTINPNVREHKLEQIRRAKRNMLSREDVGEIVLVTIPLQSANALMHEWQAMGMPAGGPDKLLARRGAKYIVYELLSNIMPQEQIVEYWQKFAPYFIKK